MAADPIPRIDLFSDGDDFDTPEKVVLLNRRFLTIRDKFGALTMSDLPFDDIRGTIDMNSGVIENAKEALKVVNLEKAGVPLNTLMTYMTTGGVIFIPRGYVATVTDTVKMKSDVQVVGCGWGSSVLADASLSPGKNVFEVTASCKNWSLMNFRINGKRTINTVGHGVLVTSCPDSQGLIQNVIIGTPRLDGDISNAMPGSGIKINNSGYVKIFGCAIRQNGSDGIAVVDSSHIEVGESRMQRSAGKGVSLLRSQNVRILGNYIEWNESSNLTIVNCTVVIARENNFRNPSAKAGSLGTKSSVYLSSARNVVVGDNEFFDDTTGSWVASVYGAKSAKYHVDITGGQSQRIVLLGNWMSDTSQLGTEGKVVRARVGGGLSSTKGYARDQNHILGLNDVSTLKRFEGGWNPTCNEPGLPVLKNNSTYNQIPLAMQVRQWDWLSRQSDRYTTKVPLVGSQPGRTIQPAQDQQSSGALTDYNAQVSKKVMGAAEMYWRTEDGGMFHPGFREIIDWMCGGRPNVLTPGVAASGHSKLDEEIGAIHATFCVYERPCNYDPVSPAGFARSVNGDPAIGWVPDNNIASMWGPQEPPDPTLVPALYRLPYMAPRKYARMLGNVLCVNVTGTRPPWAPLSGGTPPTLGSKFVVVHSGITGYIRDQRPTWVTVHT